jgi:LAO/AO transport system kinase
MSAGDTHTLAEAVLSGSRRALARLLTRVEQAQPDAQDALSFLFPHTGHAHVIGITGAPGTGKSSLVNALAKAYRQQDKTVAIIAVDPTSPFTGGAILGDRIRMQDLSGDSGVFIRSMATRGNLGGLSRTTRDAIRVMDAAGFDIILVETVGAGQSEVDIVRTAQTTIVVEAPGLGDDVQAIKAGILEIADILVVNKADRPGATNTLRALKTMLELGHPTSRTQTTHHHGQLMAVEKPVTDTEAAFWLPPIVETVAVTDTSGTRGIDNLQQAIASHQAYLSDGPARAQHEYQRIEIELYERLQQTLIHRLRQQLSPDQLRQVIDRITARELDPQAAVDLLLESPSLEKTSSDVLQLPLSGS